MKNVIAGIVCIGIILGFSIWAVDRQEVTECRNYQQEVAQGLYDASTMPQWALEQCKAHGITLN